MMIDIIIMVVVSAIIQFFFNRDFDKGLAVAVFFLVFLPVEVALGNILKGQRVVVLIILLNCFRQFGGISRDSVPAIIKLLWFVAVCRLLSSITAMDPLSSLKDTVGFVIEVVLYFMLIMTALRNRRSIEMVAWGGFYALLVVAGIATVEKYTGVNLVARVVPGMVDDPLMVSATFRHRILLGYAMAMAFPLALALKGMATTKWQQRWATLGLFAFPAACYYSNSRGPWVGCALGGATMALLGGKIIQRKLLVVLALVATVMVVRPGVRGTIVSLWHQTFTDNSIKGQSANYRLELWHVAYSQLSKGPERMLLGYGGHSTEMMDLSEYFPKGGGGLASMLGYTSWDSQYAADFMQFGFLGFGLEVVLYLVVLGMVFRAWRNSSEPDKPFVAACLAAILVYYWAMATVSIFNPQLEYLFWALVALTGQLIYMPAASRESVRNEEGCPPLNLKTSVEAPEPGQS